MAMSSLSLLSSSLASTICHTTSDRSHTLHGDLLDQSLFASEVIVKSCQEGVWQGRKLSGCISQGVSLFWVTYFRLRDVISCARVSQYHSLHTSSPRHDLLFSFLRQILFTYLPLCSGRTNAVVIQWC